MGRTFQPCRYWISRHLYLSSCQRQHQLVLLECLHRHRRPLRFQRRRYNPLHHIVDLQLGLLEKRLAVRRITITVTDAARNWLAETGYDPAYGARPLRRLIQTAIGDKLARMLIAGEVVDGGSVEVDLGEDGLVLTSR